MWRLTDQDGLRGVTSNPSIFEKAIRGSQDYANELRDLQRRGDLDAKGIYEHIAVRDIQDAADVLRPVYDQTGGADGYVSLEVSPALARDTEGTLAEARRLWQAVARANLMIKVPATPEGIPAIETLIGEGINVNVTLLFAVDAYQSVAEAYLAGLERLVAGGGDPAKVSSVASFFISRIDSAVDALLSSRIQASKDPAEQQALETLKGRTAIASGKLAYQRYKQIFAGERWRRLAAASARPQRLLWASTSTKNPQYRDVLYVEEMIGPDTVNTMPLATLDAFRDHGKLRNSLEENIEGAEAAVRGLESLGISLADVTSRLREEGVQLFQDAFDKLLAALDRTCHPQVPASLFSWTLPATAGAAVRQAVGEWKAGKKMRRLWARDASVWTGGDESKWLGWLNIVEDQLAHLHHLTNLAQEVHDADFSDALLLGMGGSSLAPEVMATTFGPRRDHPHLHVLDSTDPSQIGAIEKKLDLGDTLFIVSSKSGTTTEPNILMRYFFERVRAFDTDNTGDRFIAITDPGSKLQKEAETAGFRHIYFGLPSIGGRYSALSDFGLAPSAMAGIDVKRVLDRAEEMVHSCASCVPEEENPGLMLGAILGTLGKAGRDKVTIVASPGIETFGAWLEQLLAESTGKDGKGLIPVDSEPLGPPEVYGDDRLFVYMRLDGAADPRQEDALAALEKAGQPVVRITVRDVYDIGQEFFRWEIATAVAGSILGINPFDQPDVEASKIATRALTAEYEKTGKLKSGEPVLESDKSLPEVIRKHLRQLRPGDYFATLAYVERNPAHDARLQSIRRRVRDAMHVATCAGFGPRFLHSTGQAYKGGPNSGVFLQITCEEAADLPVPGQKYTFGVVKAAQALGDLQVLTERGRRALRVHLGKDVEAGLARLEAAVAEALS